MYPADQNPPGAPRHIAAILPEVLARYGLSLPGQAPAPPAGKAPPMAPPPIAAPLLAAAYSPR